jgi:hypothetical protein
VVSCQRCRLIFYPTWFTWHFLRSTSLQSGRNACKNIKVVKSSYSWSRTENLSPRRDNVQALLRIAQVSAPIMRACPNWRHFGPLRFFSSFFNWLHARMAPASFSNNTSRTPDQARTGRNRCLRRTLGGSIALTLAPPPPAKLRQAKKSVTKIISFGDNLNDVGNLYNAASAPPFSHWEGPASDGPPLDRLPCSQPASPSRSGQPIYLA